MSHQLELLTESPSQWTTVCYVTPEIQKKEIKPFVILAVKELEGTRDARLASLMAGDRYAAVRAVVRHVARCRPPGGWRDEDLRGFLEGIKFRPECAGELTSLLCRADLFENMPHHLRVKPALAALHWKLDLSLSQATLSSERATPERTKEILHSCTHIIFFLTLSNGRRVSYRLTLAHFHQLRYCVASALKSMIVLEKRKCMKKD